VLLTNLYESGENMKYTMKRTAENVVVMETDKGSNVKIIFQKEDNPYIEDIVTNNLLMSYEKRIKEQISNQ
jgi:hypothetical protein